MLDLSIPFTNLVTAVAFIALVMGYKYFIWREKAGAKADRETRCPWPKLPGSLPIIGNLIPGGLSNFTESVEKWAAEYGAESGMYEFSFLGRRMVVLCNEEKISLLESYRPYDVIRRARISDVMKSVGFDGLFTAEGDVWRKDRRLFGPAFNRKHIRDYLSKVKLVASRLVQKWGEKMDTDGVVSINNDVLSCMMDSISLMAFTFDMNSLSRKSKLESDLKSLTRICMLRTIFPYWKIPVIGPFLDSGSWKRNRVTQLLRNIIQDHELAASKLFERRTKSVLGKVLEERKKEYSAPKNKDRVIGNLFTLFSAGSLTANDAICSCLYQIAVDRTGLQHELASEVLALPKLEDKAELDDFLKGLPRTRSFMYEVLRLVGPTPLLILENKKTIEIDGTQILPQTAFAVLNRYASTIESAKGVPRGVKNLPPNQFCARRWLITGDNKDERNEKKLSVITPSLKNGFRAFGSGSRVCPGRAVAEVEILVILAFILRKYNIGLEEGHRPVKFVTELTQTLDADIRLVLKQRLI
jgi:cytochrome P450